MQRGARSIPNQPLAGRGRAVRGAVRGAASSIPARPCGGGVRAGPGGEAMRGAASLSPRPSRGWLSPDSLLREGRGWRVLGHAPPCLWRPPERGGGGGRRKMAAAAAAALRAWFWNERFWLPHNVTWADLAGEAGPPGSGLQYPRAAHVLSAFPLALGIFAVRLLFER